MFLFSANQRCNALPSIIGLFYHSTLVPDVLIEMLAYAGYSISLTAIQDLVTSLSGKSLELIRQLAQTLLASFAYEDFDMEFKPPLAAPGKPGPMPKHATLVPALRVTLPVKRPRYATRCSGDAETGALDS